MPNSSRSAFEISPTVTPGAKGLAHRRQQVLGARRDPANFRERALRLLRVPLAAHPRRPLELAPLDLGIEPVQLHRFLLVLREPVHAHDHALARLDLLVPAERGLLDLPLDEALLDRCDCAAELVDPLDQLASRAPRARP